MCTRMTVLTALNWILNGVVAKKLESARVSLKTMTVIAHVANCSSGSLKGINSMVAFLFIPLIYLAAKSSVQRNVLSPEMFARDLHDTRRATQRILDLASGLMLCFFLFFLFSFGRFVSDVCFVPDAESVRSLSRECSEVKCSRKVGNKAAQSAVPSRKLNPAFPAEEKRGQI